MNKYKVTVIYSIFNQQISLSYSVETFCLPCIANNLSPDLVHLQQQNICLSTVINL